MSLSCLPTFVVSQTQFVEGRRARGLHPIDELQRFQLLVVALCCSICISMIYIFDLFTTDFRERFELSAGDMSTISTIGMCVCWFVFPYGFVFNHFGPTPLLVLALIVGLTGGVCLGLVFKGVIVGSLATIAVFYAFLCSASGLLDSASIVTLAETFPRNRGLVIGIAKVMTGLGSSMWASLSLSVFQNDVSSFLFFLAALFATVAFASILFIRLPPYFMTPWRRKRVEPAKAEQLELLKPLYHTKNVPMRRFSVAFLIIGAFLVFFTVATPLKAYTHVSYGSHIALGTITVALFLCFFVMILPIRWLGGIDEPAPQVGYLHATEQPPPQAVEDAAAEDAAVEDTAGAEKVPRVVVDELSVGPDSYQASPVQKDLPNYEPTPPTSPSLGNPAALTAASASPATEDAKQAAAAAMQQTRQDPRYGGSLKSNLLKPDVWLLLFGFAFQSAIGNIIMYNGSTVSVAINGYPRTKELSALYTAFLGVGSAVGRIAMGIYEAYVQHQNPENRRFLVTMALPLPPIIAVLGCVLLLVLPGQSILLAYILIYMEEGFFNAIRAIIYPSIFESHHPVYYNMSFMSSIISIVCFNRLLFGLTVDKQHDSRGYAPGEDCKVKECVRVPIIVALAAAALAFVMQLVVHLRYRRFVHRVRRERRLQAEQTQEVIDEPVELSSREIDAMEERAHRTQEG